MLFPTLTPSREFEKVLLLQAIHSSEIYLSSAGQTPLKETVLDILRSRTIKRLSSWPSNPLLARDLKILCILPPQGDSVRSLDLASTVAGVSGLW
jgi:hypothetical protein